MKSTQYQFFILFYKQPLIQKSDPFINYDDVNYFCGKLKQTNLACYQTWELSENIGRCFNWNPYMRLLNSISEKKPLEFYLFKLNLNFPISREKVLSFPSVYQNKMRFSRNLCFKNRLGLLIIKTTLHLALIVSYH